MQFSTDGSMLAMKKKTYRVGEKNRIALSGKNIFVVVGNICITSAGIEVAPVISSDLVELKYLDFMELPPVTMDLTNDQTPFQCVVSATTSC